MFGKRYRIFSKSLFFHSIHTWQMARTILNLAAHIIFLAAHERHDYLQLQLKRQAVGSEPATVIDVVGR